MAKMISGQLLPPQPGHFVQFYQSDSSLLTQLCTFIEDGLRNQDTCVVVATKAHLRDLDELLRQEHIDPEALRLSGHYVPLDAADMLERFMVDDMPDRERFFATVGELVKLSAQRGKPLRIYGEMVALLWKDGNKDAVLQLEDLWNELTETYPCNLFCAYPELHFIMDRSVRTEIADCHHLAIPSLAV